MKGAADRKRKIIELLDILDLKNKAHNYPSQLSVGQQQRIAIARSIVHDPVILLMDEPTGSLDRENSDLIVDLLKELYNKSKPTIIIVTHDDTVAKAGTKVYHLVDGHLI